MEASVPSLGGVLASAPGMPVTAEVEILPYRKSLFAPWKAPSMPVSAKHHVQACAGRRHAGYQPRQ